MATYKSYSDPSYGSKKVVRTAESASQAGTGAVTVIERHTFMFPATITDWNVIVKTGGTAGDCPVTIGKSVAGTGTVSELGTITLATNANLSVVDGTVTETSFDAGDDLVFSRGVATTAGPFVASAEVYFKETFQATDTT
jgi:hypothetical protein